MCFLGAWENKGCFPALGWWMGNLDMAFLHPGHPEPGPRIGSLSLCSFITALWRGKYTARNQHRAGSDVCLGSEDHTQQHPFPGASVSPAISLHLKFNSSFHNDNNKLKINYFGAPLMEVSMRFFYLEFCFSLRVDFINNHWEC